MRQLCACVLGVVLSMAGATLAAAAAPVADVRQGRLSGEALDGVNVFRNIPYAAPPTGARRWAAPAPASGWSGVRDAVRPGPACLQPKRADRTVPVGETGEDCLNLNVFTPATGGRTQLPVMVWIHGGAFTFGSGSLPYYDGRALARQGVVVVTINYRLGEFGFFHHPDLAREQGDALLANFGLMDQVAALQWVRDNVASFGGDPRRVTVFGESAGGSSILALMSSPLAKGLFQQAIVQSGGGMQRQTRMPEITERGAALGRCLNPGAPTLASLRTIAGPELLETARGCRRGLNIGLYPIAGDRLLPEEVARVFTDGRQAKVPLIVGSNSWEASLMRAFNLQTDAVLQSLGPNAERLLQVYGSKGPADRDTIVSDAWGEGSFVAPARAVARSQARLGAPTWLYFFSYVTEAQRGRVPGASHGSDVLYVFNSRAALGAETVGSPADVEMARKVSAYWARFARTGDPNGGGAPLWPRHEPGRDALLELGDPIAARLNFRDARLDFHDGLTAARLAAERP